MQYAFLGNTGVKISRVTLGACFFGTRITEEDSKRIIDRSLDLGINAVDTAESYGGPTMASESVLGRLLQGRRDEVFLSTKVGPTRSWQKQPANYGLTRRVVMQAVEGSLRRLQTSHVDLMFAHFPDPTTPLEETLAAFEHLIQAGKVRYAGLSNHSASMVVEALWTAQRCGFRPVSATQDLYNLFERVNERDLYPVCRRHGVGVFAYAVLAGGLLSGKYTQGMVRDPSSIPAGARAAYYGRYMNDSAPTRSSPKLTERTIAAVARIEQWSRDHGHTTSHVGLAWALSNPAVTSVLLGVTTMNQLEENVTAFDLQFTEQQRQEIAELIPHDVVNMVSPTW